MTEAEWDTCTVPGTLLAYLVRHFHDISRRKMHLFACACCHRIWHLLRDMRSKHAVEVAERFADRLVGRKELAAARQAALTVARAPLTRAADIGFERAAKAAARCALSNGTEAGHGASQDAARAVGDAAYFASGGAMSHPIDIWYGTIAVEQCEQARLFRDILGNPFRVRLAIERSWLAWNNDACGKLAAAIYEGRPFGELPVLADALEEAGCTDASLLAHCRSGEPHVRGCWALDLLLGKN